MIEFTGSALSQGYFFLAKVAGQTKDHPCVRIFPFDTNRSASTDEKNNGHNRDL